MSFEFAIRRRTVVHGGPLREPVVLKETKTIKEGVNEIEFFRAKMSDSSVVRLLTGRSHTVNRPQMIILHRMVQLRNEAVYKVLHPTPEINININDDARPPAKKHKGSLADAGVPEMLTIVMPGAGDIPCREVRVLRGDGKDVLWVELNEDVLSHLARVINADVEAEGDRDELSDVKHITFDKSRNAYRVRYSAKYKWFPKANTVDAFAEAVRYLESLQNGGEGTTEGDVQPARD
jgi:hypothetical protein